jgi:hypothetical protein
MRTEIPPAKAALVRGTSGQVQFDKTEGSGVEAPEPDHKACVVARRRLLARHQITNRASPQTF